MTRTAVETKPELAPGPALGLAEALNGVLAASRRLRGRDARQASLTYPQYRLLAKLTVDPAVSSSQLAFVADLSPASVTEMLDRLEAAGFVERLRSETDRRLVQTRLTSRGHRALGRKHRELNEKFASAMEGLRPEELDTGVRVLERIQKYFDDL